MHYCLLETSARTGSAVFDDLAMQQSPWCIVVERAGLDETLFRGTCLWKPAVGRAVFGGQVIAQALMAACATVDVHKFALHSAHCTFLLGGDPDTPIIYKVDNIRDGKSYLTRACTATQHGTPVFVCTASFHTLEEVSSIEHAYSAPRAPPPTSLPDTHARMKGLLADPRLLPAFRGFVEAQLHDSNPIDVRYCRQSDALDPQSEAPVQLVWMRVPHLYSTGAATDAGSTSSGETHLSAACDPSLLGEMGVVPCADCGSRPCATQHSVYPSNPYERAVHACAGAFLSDFALLGTALLPHGSPNPRISFMASLDHTIWFHAPFRADDWLLYELESPRLSQGRGFALGRIYRSDGILVASTAQEGVVRFHPGYEAQTPLAITRPVGATSSAAWTVSEQSDDGFTHPFPVDATTTREGKSAPPPMSAGSDLAAARLPIGGVATQPSPTWGSVPPIAHATEAGTRYSSDLKCTPYSNAPTEVYDSGGTDAQTIGIGVAAKSSIRSRL